MLGLFSLLDATSEQLCSDLEPVLKIVGLVVWGIKIAVPIILLDSI